MRARTLSGLTAAAFVVLILPGAVAAQTSMVVADNTKTDCDAPLPAAMIAGELGSTVEWDDPADVDAEIDKLTLATDPGAEVVDVDFRHDSTEATVITSDDVTAYIVWSCAPVNGEPVQMNDEDEV